MLHSILDTDLYKLTMQQAVCTLYPEAWAKYQFFNRGGTEFPDGFARELRQTVNAMAELALTREEKDFLAQKCYYLSPVYIDFLNGYRYNPDEVTIVQEDGLLVVQVYGPWYRTILWEVPLMAMISELYSTHCRPVSLDEKLMDKNREKASRLSNAGVAFADFGTRRRFSYENHKRVVQDLCTGRPAFKGTSNLHFAMMYRLAPLGTQAHEWFMFHGAQFGFQMANDMALKKWVQVFQGDLGIALSDTFTTDIFLDVFNRKYAKLFDGVRHDSGDPIQFAKKVIQHYTDLGVDPMTKTIVFSDSLNVDKALDIHRWCQGKIRDSYGIGTHFTNDVGATPLNIVVKMTYCKLAKHRSWVPTVKLSDAPGKYIGNQQMIDLCKQTLNLGCCAH